MGLFIDCCGGGLPPILLKLGEPGSRGLEGGNESVSDVPQREPVLDPCLRVTNRVVPPRAWDRVSSSSLVTTFSAVNLGRRDFFDWHSSIDAAALLTSFPRTGYTRELRKTPSAVKEKNIRGLSRLLGCARHSRRAHGMTPDLTLPIETIPY